jgi:hypothetical protein
VPTFKNFFTYQFLFFFAIVIDTFGQFTKSALFRSIEDLKTFTSEPFVVRDGMTGFTLISVAAHTFESILRKMDASLLIYEFGIIIFHIEIYSTLK